MTEEDGQATHRFEHAGLNCEVMKSGVGHWCGYVQVPDDIRPVQWRPDHDSKHNEIIEAEVEVWGGVTYGPDDDGWVGFHDGHALSIRMKLGGDTDKEAVIEETKRFAEEIDGLRGDDDE